MNFALSGGTSLLANVLATVPGEDLALADRAAYALRMLAVGLTMVFAVLAILWIVLSISKIFLHDIPEKKKAANANTSDGAKAPVEASAGGSDDALIAVLTAAVAATLAAESSSAEAPAFRVVSFRRAERGAWNRH